MIIGMKDLSKDFVVISPQNAVSVETADASLYQRIDQNYNGFRGHQLVALHEFESDWGVWEMHPHGDELVVLMSGDITFVLKLEDGESSVRLQESGSYVTVPKGVWHTAKTSIKTKVLFITPGEGTLNQDSPD